MEGVVKDGNSGTVNAKGRTLPALLLEGQDDVLREEFSFIDQIEGNIAGVW